MHEGTPVPSEAIGAWKCMAHAVRGFIWGEVEVCASDTKESTLVDAKKLQENCSGKYPDRACTEYICPVQKLISILNKE